MVSKRVHQEERKSYTENRASGKRWWILIHCPMLQGNSETAR